MANIKKKLFYNYYNNYMYKQAYSSNYSNPQDTYNARYSNIANPAQVARWRQRGFSDAQIRQYTNQRVSSSMGGYSPYSNGNGGNLPNTQPNNRYNFRSRQQRPSNNNTSVANAGAYSVNPNSTNSAYNDTYNKRYANIATPYQINRWKQRGFSDAQIREYTDRQVRQSMARSGMQMPQPQQQQYAQPVQRQPQQQRQYSQQQPVQQPIQRQQYAQQQQPVQRQPQQPVQRQPQQSAQRQPVQQQPVQRQPQQSAQRQPGNNAVNNANRATPGTQSNYNGRSAADIRAAYKDINNELNNGMKWDPATGTYSYSGTIDKGNWTEDYYNELDRLNTLYAKMSEEEGEKYRKYYLARANALDDFANKNAW